MQEERLYTLKEIEEIINKNKTPLSSGTIMKFFGLIVAAIPPLFLIIQIIYGSNVDTDTLQQVLEMWLKFVSIPEFTAVGGVGIASKFGVIKNG